MYGPVIEGKRLRLRPPRAEDAPVMITWFEDMEVTQYLFVRTPPSLEQEKEWLDARAKDPDSIFWVIEVDGKACLLYTSPSPRDGLLSRMPSSA